MWHQLKEEQPVVMRMLEKSIEKNRLAHAYVFEGEAGTPKKEVALVLAQSQFCSELNGVVPCGMCAECRRIEHGNHPDVLMINPDGATIKKHQVEELQKQFSYKSMEARLQVYIVNEADKMTASAANSILKFLEDPESPTLAILLTENTQFILETILSRSQKLSFSPPSLSTRIALYEEKGTKEIAPLLARLSNPFREKDLLDMSDWIVQGRSLVIQLVQEVEKKSPQVLFTLQEKWLAHFKDREELELGLDLLLFWYRDCLAVKHGQADLAYPDQETLLKNMALQLSESAIAMRMQQVLEAKRWLLAHVNSQLLMERLLLRLQEGL